MERLTSNKPVSEMDMYELALNSCYIKDGKVRVRDFEDDSDARELTRKILEDIADDAFIDNTDETFDGAIADYLQYGTSEPVGLIAVFYRNLCAMADLRERLKNTRTWRSRGNCSNCLVRWGIRCILQLYITVFVSMKSESSSLIRMVAVLAVI